MRAGLFSLLVSAVIIQAATPPPTPDWNAIRPQILDYYLHILSIDTSNPPGNETKAVDYLRGVLDKEGIAYQTFALEPNRANLVVRLKGTGSKRPLLFMGHTDVVGVQRDHWNSDPFQPLRKDGFVYARGANDDKDSVTAGLTLVVLLHRLRVPLDRDVIFLAEAGEEGTSKWGMDFMADQHWDAINAEYALAEGGSATVRDGRLVALTVTTTEKAPRTTYLKAHGKAGHGSIPRLDNPVAHLAAAVAQVAAHQPPMRLNDTTRAYFEKLAQVSKPEEADRYNHVADAQRTEEIQRYFAEHEPQQYSMLRTSVVPTIIKAGFRSNVIPTDAEATLDVRILPDENLDQLYAFLRSVINDPEVEIEASPKAEHRPVSAPSPLNSEAYLALEKVQKQMYPGAVTIPMMLTGATDMAQLRAKGVKAYGIGSAADESEKDLGGAHSDNERLKEEYLYSFVQYLWNTVITIAGTK